MKRAAAALCVCALTVTGCSLGDTPPPSGPVVDQAKDVCRDVGAQLKDWLPLATWTSKTKTILAAITPQIQALSSAAPTPTGSQTADHVWASAVAYDGEMLIGFIGVLVPKDGEDDGPLGKTFSQDIAGSIKIPLDGFVYDCKKLGVKLDGLSIDPKKGL